MAITQTGAIYKAFSFDNVSSRNYGVYITGEAVYNAPERDVEMITIPGRNGAFALDQGRFENIEITYPAGVFASTEADFAQAISDFRNFLCSRKGYVRLTDEYNPDEYRLAVYKSGLEVSPSQLKAGEFEIIFDCKPQRYLTSGETAISVVDGQTIVNPTQFEASPMLEFSGYGSIGINGETVTVNDGAIGEIRISSATNTSLARLDVSDLNTGDIIINKSSSMPEVKVFITANWGQIDWARITNISGGTTQMIQQTRTMFVITIVPTATNFANGTDSTATMTMTIDIQGEDYMMYAPFELAVSYDSVARSISLVPRFVNGEQSGASYAYTYKHPAYYGISTKVVRPDTMYIDLDIGQAYGLDNNEMKSFNSIVTMPAKLPTLKAGSNVISFDNTISDLKLTPRWWKI